MGNQTEAALNYAIGLMIQRIVVEAPSNKAIIGQYVEALEALGASLRVDNPTRTTTGEGKI